MCVKSPALYFQNKNVALYKKSCTVKSLICENMTPISIEVYVFCFFKMYHGVTKFIISKKVGKYERGMLAFCLLFSMMIDIVVLIMIV